MRGNDIMVSIVSLPVLWVFFSIVFTPHEFGGQKYHQAGKQIC